MTFSDDPPGTIYSLPGGDDLLDPETSASSEPWEDLGTIHKTDNFQFQEVDSGGPPLLTLQLL